MKISSKKLGFTLIELLIVIAILGILAIGLMAALDPLEQLKRARDTANRNTVEEFYNAALRYYSVQEEFPWGGNEVTNYLSTYASNYVQSMVDSGELKQRFVDDTAGLGRIFLSSTNQDILGNMDDIAVCFRPESKAVKSDDNTKYNQSGITIDPTNCTAGGSATCFWCAK